MQDDSQQFNDMLERAWYRVQELTPHSPANRFALGQAFHELRALYSDRNSGGRRLTSGHGSFEAELRKRTKYSVRTVRDMIADFEAHQRGGPSTAQRKSQRRRQLAAATDPLTAFARLLPYPAAKAAYREAAKACHPDHGGSNVAMQRLNAAWERAQPHLQGAVIEGQRRS